MTTLIKVTKRDGSLEDLDLDKIHKVVDWASEGLDVSVSQVEINSNVQFYNGISTSEIHQTMVKAAADLISVETPDYQLMAARLLIFGLRKVAYGGFVPPSLKLHAKSMVEQGLYDKSLLSYSDDDFYELDVYINHSRDLNFSYAAVKQLEGKYLVQNRVTKRVYETPQMLYMFIAMTLFMNYPLNTRLGYVKRFYDAASTFKISLPTPIMSGVRTPTRQFSSCTLIECGDSLDSINATSSAIVKYISQKAGIGVNVGRVRALGSPVRNNSVVHTGVIPFLKLFQAAVKSCSQGAIRNGSATAFYPFWHLEVENLLVLKNNRGVEDNRVRQLDYGVQLNKMMYQRLIEGGNITLFSPNDVEDLYEAFFADQELFERLYVKYEADESIRKKSVKAIDLFSVLMQERASTGRIYIQHVDHCNTHSAFNPELAPIKQSNLCLEITLPTKPLNNINDGKGEISLCTLGAVNLGELEELDDLENLADLLVRGLNEILDFQDYPVTAAEVSTLARRPLGIGVINYAYYLAKNGLKYSDGSASNLTHRTFEALQYYCLKASNSLAREKGICPAYNDTTYAEGILPIDTYKKELDKVCDQGLELDWEKLRRDIGIYGLRNSTLTALMPSETSSQIANATNGIEPPRGLVATKVSRDGVLKQVVPSIGEVSYELLWDLPDNKGYLTLAAIMQKFIDQAISTNTSYDPTKFEGGKVPMKTLLNDILLAYKLGLKTLYYHNTRDGSGEEVSEDGCEGGACKI